MNDDHSRGSDDALVRVARRVTHDLGNLLNVIAGHVSLLERLGADDADSKELLQEIKKSVSESVERVHELASTLRYSRDSPTLMGKDEDK